MNKESFVDSDFTFRTSDAKKIIRKMYELTKDPGKTLEISTDAGNVFIQKNYFEAYSSDEDTIVIVFSKGDGILIGRIEIQANRVRLLTLRTSKTFQVFLPDD
ncbi:MAG: hypothetical protein QXP36_09020 [Conexivisphaerales archaeon]